MEAEGRRKKEWNVKLKAFENRFQTFKDKYVFSHSKVLLVGARSGQEVVAMRNIGVVDSIGIDLVEDLPLVLAGDMHSLQFSDNTYDFIFSNVFDHALYPEKFGHELYRTLKVGGYVCLRIQLDAIGDKYTATRVQSIKQVTDALSPMQVVSVEQIKLLGMDREICFKKVLQ